ncbi:MAG: hypothetical protein CMO81_00340 [Waddliaceae bacterium]|nr:hypothetical protein [Waddliaceae bacterium]
MPPYRKFLLLLLTVSIFLSISLQSEVLAVYLCLDDHPEKHMTIRWISPSNEEKNDVYLKTTNVKQEFKHYEAFAYAFPEQAPYSIHTLALRHLSPDTEYIFKLCNSEEEYRFRTLPSKCPKELRFIVGGDMFHDDLDMLENMNRLAASLNPDFIGLGGDISYSLPRQSALNEDPQRWLDWLQSWSKHMKRTDGTL